MAIANGDRQMQAVFAVGIGASMALVVVNHEAIAAGTLAAIIGTGLLAFSLAVLAGLAIGAFEREDISR